MASFDPSQPPPAAAPAAQPVPRQPAVARPIAIPQSVTPPGGLESRRGPSASLIGMLRLLGTEDRVFLSCADRLLGTRSGRTSI